MSKIPKVSHITDQGLVNLITIDVGSDFQRKDNGIFQSSTWIQYYCNFPSCISVMFFSKSNVSSILIYVLSWSLTSAYPDRICAVLSVLRGWNSQGNGSGSKMTWALVASLSNSMSLPVVGHFFLFRLKAQRTPAPETNISSSAMCWPRHVLRPNPKVCIPIPSRRFGYRESGSW